MPTCTLCGQTKRPDAFVWKYKARGIRASRCKTCTRTAIRAHYQKNSSVYKKRAIDKRDAIRELIRQAKSVPCADCGEYYPYYVMEFDHVRGRKSTTVSRMVNAGSIDRVHQEMAKCDVVCSNCHRFRTHQRSANGQHATLRTWRLRDHTLPLVPAIVVELDKTAPCEGASTGS